MGKRKRGGSEPFELAIADHYFDDDGADATCKGASRLLFPFEDRTPDADVEHALWKDRAWTQGEREAVRDAGVGRTENGQRQRGERFGALFVRTDADAGRDGSSHWHWQA